MLVSFEMQQYRDEVVRQHVLSFAWGQARIMTLQQDTVRPHVSRVVTDFLCRQNIQVMEWPVMSSDMGWNGTLSVAALQPASHAARIGRSSPWGVARHPKGFLNKLRDVYATAMYLLRSWQGSTHSLLIVRTLFWAPLTYDVINAYVSVLISSTLAVCSTTRIITLVSKIFALYRKLWKCWPIYIYTGSFVHSISPYSSCNRVI